MARNVIDENEIMKNKRVYDDRTDETLFIGTEIECMDFIDRHLIGKPSDIDYIWIENKKL